MTLINPKGSGNSYNITDPFPWDERTSLVIYAAKSFDDNPDKSFPSLVYDQYDSDTSGLISDGAPYLTALDAKDMLNDIRRWKEKASQSQDYEQALKTERWVKEKINEKWTHFLYETEPPKYAGNAYVWAKHAEKNKNGK